MEYIKLLIGLALLIFGGDYLVKGSVAIAKRFRVSSLIVGMTIVAFGTSAPELLVSLMAAFQGNPEIALGNVIGSNIANIGLILGLTAIILPITVHLNSLKNDVPVMILASLLFWLAASSGEISRFSGIVGFSLLIAYVVWSIYKGRKEIQTEEIETSVNTPLRNSLALIAVAPVMLTLGADFLIDGTSTIAFNFGVSERVIGVTVVAFGTSIPELVASVAAALKREMDISVGNIVGSNLFNILSVIGLTAAIKPIPVDYSAFRSDFAWMLLFAALLLILMFPLRKTFQTLLQTKPAGWSSSLHLSAGVIGRVGGVLLLGLYIYYIIKLF